MGRAGKRRGGNEKVFFFFFFWILKTTHSNEFKPKSEFNQTKEMLQHEMQQTCS
jgi:hypothetical protein